MSNVATPTVPQGGTPPAAPVVTPTVIPSEQVTLTKEEVDQLKRDAARASNNQRKADLYDRVVGKNGHFKPQAPAAPPSEDERQVAAAAEDRKAERGLLALAADPAFREALDTDPTLRDLLVKNPLAVLPMLAPDALDADDAVSLVKEALNRRKPVTPPPVIPPSSPPTPPTGAINPNDKPANEEVETARKLPNTEKAIAGMIGARLRANAGKK